MEPISNIQPIPESDPSPNPNPNPKSNRYLLANEDGADTRDNRASKGSLIFEESGVAAEQGE